MKSLPSYDEALKRVSTETQIIKKIPIQHSSYTKSNGTISTSKSVDINCMLNFWLTGHNKSF